MDVFNSYLEGDERAFAIEQARFDLEWSRYQTMLEMVELHHAQQIRDAEFKVFSEGGTYDDLQYLIEEANQETAQQNQGVINQLFTAIGNMIQGFINAITRFFGGANKIPDNAPIQLNDEQAQKLGMLDSLTGGAKNIISKIVNGDIAGAKADISSTLPWLLAAGAAAGTVGVAIKSHMKSSNGKDIKDEANKANSVMGMIKNAVDNLKSKVQANAANQEEVKKAQEGLNLLRKMTGNIQAALQTIGQTTKDWVGAIFDTVDANANPDQGNANQQGDANQQPAAPQPTQEQMNKRVSMADRAKAGGALGAEQKAVMSSADDLTDEELRQQSIFGELFGESYVDEESKDADTLIIDEMIEAFKDML